MPTEEKQDNNNLKDIQKKFKYVYLDQNLQLQCSLWTGVLITYIALTEAVQYNPTSDISDDRNMTNRTNEASDESGHEIESDDDVKEKKFLDEAMKKILDPDQIQLPKAVDIVDHFKLHLEELDNTSIPVEDFMEEMDKLSLEVCKTSQEALWAYVTDIGSEAKKNNMVSFKFK